MREQSKKYLKYPRIGLVQVHNVQYEEPELKKEYGVDNLSTKKRVLIGLLALGLNLLSLVGLGLAFGLTFGLSNKYDVRNNYGEVCSNDNGCLLNANLICDNGVCNCSLDTYYNGSICAFQKGYNNSCKNTIECLTQLNYACTNSSRCDCKNGYYYSSSKSCEVVGSYFSNCTGNNSCDSSKMLYCNNNTSKCVCPNFNYFSTNTSICTSQKIVNSSCATTTECRTDLGLSCSSAKICACQPNYYWSLKSQSCLVTSTINGTCSSQTPCDSTTLLSCVGTTCQCSSNYYWSGSTCALKMTYGLSCSNSIQCQDFNNLQCVGSLCSCASNIYYWNGISCQLKVSNSDSCVVGNECQDYNFLVCINQTCQCASTDYLDPLSLACRSKLGINSTCTTIAAMCQTDRGLSCLSNTCSCESTSYWDETQCLKKKTYNITCSMSVECNDAASLLCLSSICSCQSGYFFNGANCIPLRIYNESCISTSDCYTTGGLLCKSGTCDCPLSISDRMYWVPAYNECRILPKNCKEVLQGNPSAQSGIFYLASSIGLLEAYCEMVIDSGGYTFLPWSSLSQSTSTLRDIYTDTSRVLFRIISRTNANYQPYVLTQQLNMYQSIPISVLENSNAGFTVPGNVNVGPYVFVGFLPYSIASQINTVQGLKANGIELTFSNCDGTANSYIALFANLNPTNPSSYSVGAGLLDSWKASAIAHPLGTYMPSNYFYFGEFHQGGCGGYQQSDRWPDYYGVAFGLR